MNQEDLKKNKERFLIWAQIARPGLTSKLAKHLLTKELAHLVVLFQRKFPKLIEPYDVGALVKYIKGG
jgi:hypothetical protein